MAAAMGTGAELDTIVGHEVDRFDTCDGAGDEAGKAETYC